jgi:hypothetical protein
MALTAQTTTFLGSAMAGRRITNTSKLAQRKREYMRQVREAMKQRPASFNPAPLERVIQNWKRT